MFKMGQALSSGFRKAGGVTKKRKPDKGTSELTQKNSFAAKHLVEKQVGQKRKKKKKKGKARRKDGEKIEGSMAKEEVEVVGQPGNTREPEKTDSVQSLCSAENNSLDGGKKQNPPDYNAYLNDLQEASKAGFDDLCNKANQLQREIPPLSMKKKGNFHPVFDKNSQDSIPTGKWKDKYFALHTTGDGNCLFRAASILACGDESKHTEMRVRTVLELACNKSHYLNVPNIKERISAQEQYILRKSSGEGRDKCSGELDKLVLEVDFEGEVCNTCKDSTWASDWHLQALPTVFQHPVKIVFPQDIRGLERFFNDYIHPRDSPSTSKPLVIMWTSTMTLEEKMLNHFVPLVLAGEVCSLRKESGGQTPGDCERQNIAGNTREPEKTDSVQSLCSENNSLDGDKKQNPPGNTKELDQTDSLTPLCPGSLAQDPTKLNVTLATDVEGWDKSVNDQFLLELAGNSQVRVTGFVPLHTQEQKEHARELNIELFGVDEDLSGFKDFELLAHPPDCLDIDVLIIHSYGHDLGKQAQIIKKKKECLWFNVVHTVSEDLEKFLDKKSANPAANDQISLQKLQTILCEKSDLVIAIGPKVTEAYRTALRYSDKDKNVIDLTPGIIKEFDDVRRNFRVLLSASFKYFLVKGCDIATKAIILSRDPSYHLIFVRQPKDNEDQLKKAFLDLGINQLQLTFRSSSGNKDFWPRLLSEVHLVIKPSRTEGFGISGLRAISAEVPVLVSGNCGLGMVLKSLPSGAQHVIDSEDPQAWADAIKKVRAKAVQVRKAESEQLRKDYMQRFNWKMQCDGIVKKMFSMNPHKSEHRKEVVERQFDVAETTRDLQSLDLNRDDVDGGRYHHYETEKMSIQETSQSPCTYKRGDIPRRNMEVNNLPLKEYRKLCLMLNTKRDLKFDDFRMLAKKVGFSGDEIRIIDQGENPADAVLQTWSSKREATVGNLIDLLTGKDLERMDVAKVLEDWVNETC